LKYPRHYRRQDRATMFGTPAFLFIILSIVAALPAPTSAAAAPNAKRADLKAGATHTAPTANLSRLITEIQAEVNPEEAMDFMRRVYSTDRWFNFEKFGETADYLKGAMQQMGLERVDIGYPPADGVTQAGFWTVPLAWDAKAATLEIVDPPVSAESRVLCDYRKVPTSLGEWSGSTPPAGLTAEVVEIPDWPPERIASMNLRGKLALTDENPADIKWALVKAGALGAINASTENPSLQDARQWMNAWGDYGWAFIKGSTPLLYFSITPREATLIRTLLAEHGAVRVRATVNAHYYSGVYPYTTGVIPGRGPEEVLALGHTSEEGAGDNASGVAALMEAMVSLNRLIAAGTLPTPKRSIRILAMPEMYGSMYYIQTHPAEIRHTVAAICLDTPAERYDLAGAIYSFYTNPDVASSYTDSFILKVADMYLSALGRSWHWHPFDTGTDSYLGDPTIGVPTVWAYSGNDVYTPHHSSADTPDRVDTRSLRDLTVVTAAYLYYLANAGEPEAVWLAETAQDWGDKQVLRSAQPFVDQLSTARTANELGSILNIGIEKIHYTVTTQKQAVLSVVQLVPDSRRQELRDFVLPFADQLGRFGEQQSETLRRVAGLQAKLLGLALPVRPMAVLESEDAVDSGIIVKRLRFGTIPLDQISPPDRRGYPSGAWDLVPIIALYWCDGHRNLAQVKRLTEMELGPSKFDFVGYFRFLRDQGFVQFVKGE
jgi:Peptidase family M28